MAKAPGLDGLTVEHIVNCHPIITVELTSLFNYMLQLGYVPDVFGTGVILPLIKNTSGDTGSSDNYCGITLSPTYLSCVCFYDLIFYSLQNFSLASTRNDSPYQRL